MVIVNYSFQIDEALLNEVAEACALVYEWPPQIEDMNAPVHPQTGTRPMIENPQTKIDFLRQHTAQHWAGILDAADAKRLEQEAIERRAQRAAALTDLNISLLESGS